MIATHSEADGEYSSGLLNIVIPLPLSVLCFYQSFPCYLIYQNLPFMNQHSREAISSIFSTIFYVFLTIVTIMSCVFTIHGDLMRKPKTAADLVLRA